MLDGNDETENRPLSYGKENDKTENRPLSYIVGVMIMYAVILAGGSGTRLWPLSRELYPKQYLTLPVKSADSYSPEEDKESETSLFINTVRRVLPGVEKSDRIVVVTHRDQSVEIKRQLDTEKISGVRLLAEPEARNTAPAIGIAAWYIAREAGDSAVMAVLPSDHLITDWQQFGTLLEDGSRAAETYGLVTFGIRPTYPETGYGYIRCGEKLNDKTSRIDKFVEKPDLEKASQYIKDPSYLWNSGMFVFRVGALKEAYHKHLPEMYSLLNTIDFNQSETLEKVYGSLEKISIDYGILERAEKVTVIPTEIGWSDLGSWESYYQVANHDQYANFSKGRVISFDTEGSLIYSGSRLIGTLGVRDTVIVDTDDALLVCDRSKAQDVRLIVDQLKKEKAREVKEHLTNYRPWGSYTTLELGDTYQVKRINVNPGARLSLQSHKRRAENWVVVEGEALVTVDDRQIAVKKGESAYIPRQARHRMENKGSEPLVLIEVQNGDYLGEDDIVRYEDDYGRSEDAPVPVNNLSSGGQQIPDITATRLNITARERFDFWLTQPDLDPAMRSEIQAMESDPAAIESHFGNELAFGTGGMRGLIGPGINRINCYTIKRATQGLANYLNKQTGAGSKKVAIAYDTRHHSEEFALAAALVLAANGIRALLFDGNRPTPLLSFATRQLGCAAGIVITASHNPPGYNGYKVYGPDGGQGVSPFVDDIIREINQVDIFHDVKVTDREEAQNRGLLEIIDPTYDNVYLEQVRSLSLNNPDTCLRVAYTPLHGTGAVHIPTLLESMNCLELSLVSEQLQADPDFSTVKVPNPEDPAALDLALKLARRIDADLVLATDPDADRVGTAVRDNSGNYQILSGNQVGALLIEYICSNLAARNALPQNPVLVKTIVTGDLGCRVARSYGLQVEETLTGFKFIGEKIEQYDEAGTPDFIFGYEESCGYLTGTFVRDKDAAISSYMIAEMTAYYKEQGKTLLDVLEQIQQKHGYFAEELLTIELKDISEADRHVAAYHNLPVAFAGQQITVKKDYDSGVGRSLADGREFALELPRSPVLHYTLDDGSWFAVRPSGTEPKVKIYLSVCDQTPEGAAEKLIRLREAVKAVG